MFHRHALETEVPERKVRELGDRDTEDAGGRKWRSGEQANPGLQRLADLPGEFRLHSKALESWGGFRAGE